MPQISASEAFKQMKKAVESKASEASALSTAQRALAQLGYHKLPKHEATKSDVGTVRIYTFDGTPCGTLVLVAGPSIKTELHLADELARAAADPGYYVQVTGSKLPKGLAERLSAAKAAGKADVKRAIEAGEIKAPVEVKPPPAPAYPRYWTPSTTGAERMDMSRDERFLPRERTSLGGGHFEVAAHRREFPELYAPPAPPPAPAPLPSGMSYAEPGERSAYGKPPKTPRAPRAPKAAPAAPAAAGGLSAADMAMLQQVFAAAIKAEMGK